LLTKAPNSRLKSALSKSVATALLAATALVTSAAAAQAAPVAGFNRETYNFSTQLSLSQEANRYQAIVLQATNGSKVAALHAANPALRIFMYQDPKLSRTTDPSGMTVCTSYQTDSASHPNWFLTDQSGRRTISPQNNGADYYMDIGDSAYQQACLTHAVALAKKYGFDGVYFDDLSAWIGWGLPRGSHLPKYPTISAWQAAMYSLISYAAPTVHTNGLLLVGNIGGATMTAGLWQKWTGPLDGSEEESWTDGGAGLAQQSPDWTRKLANVAWSEANGKIAILHSYNTTEPGNTYGLASMMLVANGESNYSTANGGSYTSYEMWYPEYGTAQQLGAPTGAYSKLADGVYERVFQNGIVLVNPSTTSIPAFSLGGGIYSGSQLNNVTSVSMGPTSGLILLRV
jgi:hypothetical protein